MINYIGKRRFFNIKQFSNSKIEKKKNEKKFEVHTIGGVLELQAIPIDREMRKFEIKI